MSLLTRAKERVKDRLGPLWWYTAVFFCAQRAGDLINIYIGLWLVPHWIPQEQLGAILPLGQIGALLGLPLAVLLMPFLKFLSVFAVRGEMGKVKAMIQDAFVLVLVASIGVATYTYLACPFVFERMRVGDRYLMWLLVGLALTGAFTPVLTNALQSQQRFRVIAAISLVPPPVRLAAILLLLPAFGVTQYFAVQLLAVGLTIAIALWGLRHVLAPSVKRESYREYLPEIARFTWPVLILTVAGNLQGTCETFVIRHFLSDTDSAAFYLISRFAEIPHGLWSAMSIAFFPLVSARHEQGQDTSRILRQAMVFILLFGGLASLLLAYCSDWILGLTADWRAYRAYGWLMGVLLLRTVLLQAAACFSAYEIACRRFAFAGYTVALALLEALLLYGLGGLGFFHPYLPESWWQVLVALPTHRLDFVTAIMLGYTLAIVLCIFVHLALRSRPAPGRKS